MALRDSEVGIQRIDGMTISRASSPLAGRCPTLICNFSFPVQYFFLKWTGSEFLSLFYNCSMSDGLPVTESLLSKGRSFDPRCNQQL